MTDKNIPSTYKVFNVDITQTVSFSIAARSAEEAKAAIEDYGVDEFIRDSMDEPDVEVYEDKSCSDLENVENGVSPEGDLLEVGDWLACFPDFDESSEEELEQQREPDTQTLPLFPKEDK